MNVPQEIFDEWEVEWWETVEPGGECDGYEFFANKAAEWAYKKGADDELDACLAWFKNFYKGESWMLKDLKRFRETRRRPETLNDIALKMLETIEKDGRYLPEITDTIRKALKENK